MNHRLIRRMSCLILTSAVFAPTGNNVRADELTSRMVNTPIDSGMIQNTGHNPAVIFSEVVRIDEAPWIRLTFDEIILSGQRDSGNETYLQITSLRDSAFQILNAESLAQWQNTSAYFNGDAVRIELIAFPNTGDNRLVIRQTIAGLPPAEPRSICGTTDDRVLSNDPRVARIAPVGCTAWMIDDENHCFLSAGHCAGANLQTIQFNVPLSNSNGSWNHPPPQDQYSIDQSSRQSANTGLGNDWAYFGCFPNSTTGLTPYQAMGAYFVTVNPPPVSGQNIRITGYGTVSAPVSPTWNSVQKTHAGPYFSLSGTVVRYTTDTTGGNSGSPIINEATGEAIGIHTNGGCSSTGGSNSGTGRNNTNLQNALNNPLGVCDDDQLPPTPNPMAFSISPYGSSPTTITMQAVEAVDATSPPVQYLFDFTGGGPGGTDSPWQISRDYVDIGLQPNSGYSYVVRARDSNVPTPRVTGNSPTVTVATPIETPTGISFGTTDDTSIAVTADGTFTNIGLGTTGFFFEMTPPAGSGANIWVSGTNASVTGLTPCTQYTFRVKARNYQSTETAYAGPVVHYTTGCTGCGLVGDVNGSGTVEGGDIAGFVRTKMGAPAGNDYAQCADYGTGTLEGDTEMFVGDLLAK